MREYLKRVLELVRPYPFRFVLGLACGFLSGMLAFTLPVTLSLAVDTVFPNQKAGKKPPVSSTNLTVSAIGPGTNQASAGKEQLPSGSDETAKPPTSFKRSLNSVRDWLRPSGPPSTTRKLLIISLIPAAMLLRGLFGYLNIY